MNQRIPSKTTEVKQKDKKDLISYGLPASLQSFVDGLTEKQKLILREIFYLATRSTVACNDNGFVGFETTYGWIAYRVGCHPKTVQNLVHKLKDEGLLKTHVTVKQPSIYRFIQFLKKKWVRNLLYRLLTPVVFVASSLSSLTIQSTNSKLYPHINYKEYIYRKSIEKLIRRIREKEDKKVDNEKGPNSEIGNFKKNHKREDREKTKYRYETTRKPTKVQEDEPTPQCRRPFVAGDNKAQTERESKTIWELFFDFHTNAHPLFRKNNPYRNEFQKTVDNAINGTNISRKAFIARVFNVYCKKKGLSNEEIRSLRETKS